MYYVWHKKLWPRSAKGWTYKRKVSFFLGETCDACLLVCFIKEKNTHTHSIMTQSNKCAKTTSWNSRYFKSLEPMIFPWCKNLFFSSFSFLFHNAMKFTFRWALMSPSCDSFHLMIVHMFCCCLLLICSPYKPIACSRRSDCGEPDCKEMWAGKTLGGWGRGWEQTHVTLTPPLFHHPLLFLIIFPPSSVMAHSTIWMPWARHQLRYPDTSKHQVHAVNFKCYWNIIEPLHKGHLGDRKKVAILEKWPLKRR